MRLTYRQIEREDLGILRDWRNQYHIRNRTREHRLLNMINQVDWFESMSRNKNNEMYLMSVDFLPVGVCGLCYIDWVNRNAEVSLYIGNDNMRRQGIGTKVLKFLEKKAFDEFNLHRLWAEIYSNNVASRILFEKCGYTKEGKLREHVFKGGKYRDSFIYGLLKEEVNGD